MGGRCGEGVRRCGLFIRFPFTHHLFCVRHQFLPQIGVSIGIHANEFGEAIDGGEAFFGIARGGSGPRHGSDVLVEFPVDLTLNSIQLYLRRLWGQLFQDRDGFFHASDVLRLVDADQAIDIAISEPADNRQQDHPANQGHLPGRQ